MKRALVTYALTALLIVGVLLLVNGTVHDRSGLSLLGGVALGLYVAAGRDR